MNRRRFIQSVAALVSVPTNFALPFQAAAASKAAVVPMEARSWAIYISTLHGECPPKTLQTMLNIPAGDAKRYITQLIADGSIKPNPLLKRTVSELVRTDENSLFNKVKKRLDMKMQDEPQELVAVREEQDEHLYEDENKKDQQLNVSDDSSHTEEEAES